jgi:YfiH family protein
MNSLLEKLKFVQFDVFPELIHAVSPRCFENDNGGIEEFSFQGNGESGDDRDHIKRFLKSIEIENLGLFLVNQVHGDKVFVLDDPDVAFSEVKKISADALLTHLPGKPIGIFTADCLPILVYDPRLKVIGAIHAGRMGSAQSIILKVVREMVLVYGSRPAELVMGIGPAIGGCCYEVGEDCIQPFKELFPDEKGLFRSGLSDSYFLDLVAVNKVEGVKAGLLPENIFSMNLCTCCSTRNLYSYRREGKTGRILTTIMLRP